MYSINGVGFSSKEEKEEYVRLERQFTLKELTDLFRAITPEERASAKKVLDKRRNEFAKQWKEEKKTKKFDAVS